MTVPTLSLDLEFDSGTETVTQDDFGREPGFSIVRGTSQLVTTGFVADPGTLTTVLDNIDRRYDPNYLVGPHVTAGQTDVVPGVGAVGSVNWDALRTLFVGRADGWPQDYPLDGADQVVQLSATDAIGFF